MDIYKDMLKKIQYYKENIINSFVKKGYFPTNEDIISKLNLIETRTSLCKTYLSKPGSFFNTKEINYIFEMIYKDLSFLYEILEDILLNEYNQLKMYIETHLNELESKASLFQKRLQEEMSATSFGNIILFQSDNWNITTSDATTIIDLGKINLCPEKKIALFANINNIENNKVSFKLIANNKENSFDALPYNYNNNTYIIPGEREINESELNLNGRIIVNDNIEINMNVDQKNDYKILGGKDLMTVTYVNGDKVLQNLATSYNVFYATQDCAIEFYCYKNPIIQYNFNKKPIHCNFPISDNYIHINDLNIKKVYLKVEKGFSCYFIIEDGEIWASCEDGIIISNNCITYSGNWDLRDFKILEYVNSNDLEYNIKVFIDSEKDIISNIDSIYIKQIN